MIPLNNNLYKLQRSQIRVFTNLARETPDCAMLTIGEPDFDTPEAIKASAIDALNAGLTHYAPNQGTLQLRQAIADYETARGNAVTAEQVLVTVGACQALFTTFLGILNPGEEVIVPTPGFGLYESLCHIAGAKMVELDISKTGFQIDPDALKAAITPKTKAILLNSPNNPTGAVLNEQSLTAVKEAVLGKPIFVIWDNVYNQLAYGPCPDLSLDADLREQMILCQSFSKPYAMTGWRVGYLTCPDYVMERFLLLSAATITAVPTFLQEAEACLSGSMDLYKRMLAAGIAPEDARYVTPQAVVTNLVMTANARELRHFFRLRCCNRAQWEIRRMADKMLIDAQQQAEQIVIDATDEIKSLTEQLQTLRSAALDYRARFLRLVEDQQHVLGAESELFKRG